NDHFINLREIRIGHLSPNTSVQLLTRPIPKFPDQAIPEQVAEEIFMRTGGHPYLLQLYGSLLVTCLNHQKRGSATLEDIGTVEDEVLSLLFPRHLHQSAGKSPHSLGTTCTGGNRNQRPKCDALVAPPLFGHQGWATGNSSAGDLD
ncbi:MAG: hypothetical protein ACREBC_34030, partial [Pyrinomonadaceae bacterium]